MKKSKPQEGETLSLQQRQRLNTLAEQMRTAKGKALDAIVTEVDQIIGMPKLEERDTEAEEEAQGRWKRQAQDEF